MLPVIFVFVALIVAIGSIVLGAKFYFNQKSLQRKQKEESSIFIKKYNEINPAIYRPVFLKLGMVLSLTLSITIISWTTYERVIEPVGEPLALDEFEIEVPRTKPEPPPPPPPEPPIIEVIENDKPVEDEIEFNIEINIEDEIDFTEGIEEIEDEQVEEKEFRVFAEEMPQFPGGEEALLKYLGNIKYPDIARDNDIQGKVHVRFIIDKNGKVTNISVVKGVNRILNEAAIKHVEKMPKWTPGRQKGRAVRVQYVLPINFVIN